MSQYKKTITAVVTGLIGWATLVVSSDPAKITSSEWVMGATVLATALGVYAVSNEPTDTDGGLASFDFLVGAVLGGILGVLLVATHVIHVG